MKVKIFHGMIALFILFLALLVFAPKVLAGIAVVVSVIPLAGLILSLMGLVWIAFTDDVPLKQLRTADE